MIYDCFSFFNELDILELRLNVLKDVVDRFVLVEAVRKHSGEAKPLYFEANKARFAEFADRIIHIIVDDEPETPPECPKLIASWAFENHQRNAIVRGLKDAKPEDTIMISDLDEIPDPEKVKEYAGREGVGMFDLLATCFYFNLVSMNYPRWTRGTKILTWKTFNDERIYNTKDFGICMPEFANRGPTATRIRFLKPDYVIKNAGWHFSYYGGAEKVWEKMRAIADNSATQDGKIDLATVKARLAAGRDPYGRSARFYAVPFDERFPKWLRDHRERFAAAILPCESVSLATRIVCVFVRLRTIAVDFAAGHIPKGLKPLAYAIYSRVVANPVPLSKNQLLVKTGE